MALMNLNLDGVLTVEKVVVPADGITGLSHSLFRGEKIIVRYNGDELTRGQDFIPDRIDDRLYFQKNVCLFTALKILNESLFGQEIEVEYFACGDYINAEIWNEYPSSASLKASLASKVDNSDFTKEVKRIDGDINAESTARTDADKTLQDNINAETNLRIAEDEKLQTNINNEATARADADSTLQNNINKEAAARESADNEIRNELSSETNLRLAGDSNLQTQISDLKTKFESFVPGLTYKVVSALPTADILNDVIYLVPADSTGSQSVYDEYIYIDGNWELIGTTATTQAITVDSALSETSTNPVQNKVITAELKSRGKVYTSLSQLGLTADATLDDVVATMPKGSSALIGVTEFTNAQTMFPYEEGNDYTFGRVYIVKGNDNGRTYAKWFRKDGAKEAIAKFHINTNKFDGWQEITAKEILHTDLSGNLEGITTVLDLVNALLTEYRATSPKKPIRFISGEITKTTLTDLPRNYGLLQITVSGYDVVDVSFAGSSLGFKTLHYGFVNRTSSETLFSSLFWEIVDIPIAELTDLGLDGSATIQNIMDAMTVGQHCILNTSRFDDKTQVGNIEYGKVEIRRLSSGMWSLWLEDVLHGNVVAHGTCSASKFAGWQYLASKDYVDSVTGNTFNGKSVKTLMIDLSNSSLQYTGTSDYGEVSLANYINNNINIIRVEGYYNPPSDSSYNNKYVVVAGKGSGTGIGYMSYLNSKWSFVAAKSKGGSLKGNGFIKVYYID